MVLGLGKGRVQEGQNLFLLVSVEMRQVPGITFSLRLNPLWEKLFPQRKLISD